MRKTLAPILLSISILVLGCGSSKASGYGPVATAASTPNITHVAKNTVTILPGTTAMFVFSPAKLTVHQNTRVTWFNQSMAPHTIKGVSGWHFLSKIFRGGQKVSFIFRKLGTYRYVCSIHPFMHGKIVVTK